VNLLDHERDTVGDFQNRVLIHIPIGIILSIPILGWGLIPLFIRYQDSENEWTRDQAWKDYAGAIVGFIIGIALLFILGIYVILIL